MNMGIGLEDLKNSVNNGSCYPVYVFCGEDAYIKSEGIKFLKNKFIAEPSLNFSVIDNDNFSLSDVIVELKSFPFMSERRAVLISEFYPEKTDLKAFNEYLNDPIATSFLIINNERPFEAFNNDNILTVDANNKDSFKITRFIIEECKKNNVYIDNESASLLLEYCLSDLMLINNEINKLVSYVGENGKIDKSVVELMVSKDTEFKIYEMTDYISKKKFDKAIFVVNELLGKGESPQRLLQSIYNYFRRLLHSTISSKSDQETAKLLDVKEYALTKMKEQAKRFKVTSIKKAVDKLCDADYMIKSGRTDVYNELWLNVFKIMAE